MAAPPRLAQIPRVWVDQVWPEAVKHLRRAYDRMGGDPPARMYRRVMNGEADLWCIYDGHDMLAAALAGISGSRAVINTIGGRDMPRWVHLLAEFEDLARQHGMTEIEIEGRDGWSRALHGYRKKRVVIGKAL